MYSNGYYGVYYSVHYAYPEVESALIQSGPNLGQGKWGSCPGPRFSEGPVLIVIFL